MLALANFTLRGPYQAAAVVGSVGVLALLMDLMAGATLWSGALALMLNLISVVLVALIVLTQGVSSALKPVLAAVAAVVAVGLLVAGTPNQAVSLVGLQWLPVAAMAQGLRSSGSLGLALIVGAVLGMLGVGLEQVWWAELEAGWLTQFVQASAAGTEANEEQVEQLRLVVRLMMVVVVPSLFLTWALVLLVARHLQAKVAQSGGFGAEFRGLALGKPAAAAGFVIVGAALMLQQPWGMSLALLVVIAFMFQGIAIVHSRLQSKQQAIPLLVLFYVLLLFMWQIAGVLTAITGMIDNWLAFRKKSETPDDLN
ncbi:MAG: DUF2232 domain-containing protein [Gammaproteobacteria bacterium]|nr:DUF2232 domain-containing protein [Gammaproteobacteria bacterium]